MSGKMRILTGIVVIAIVLAGLYVALVRWLVNPPDAPYS